MTYSASFADIRDIVAAACSCHDMGNPPFGHGGEKTISAFFREGAGRKFRDMLTERQWADLINFEGNANSFRLLTHEFKGRRRGGMAMTYSTLASIVKYPYSSLHSGSKGKFGFLRAKRKSTAGWPHSLAFRNSRRAFSRDIRSSTSWRLPTISAIR